MGFDKSLSREEYGIEELLQSTSVVSTAVCRRFGGGSNH